MRNIIFLRIFELSACWHRRYSAFTAFETAKIAYIAGGTENKHLAQEARISFLYTDAPL